MEKNNRCDNSCQESEEGERLVVHNIVVPADEGLSLQQGEITASHLADYQGVVDGNVGVVQLDRPPASMYFNEEGKFRDLAVNRRATLLLWLHRPVFRYSDYIAGDALLVGPADQNGNDTNVPDELAELLFQTQHFRVEVETYGDPGWYGNQRRFDQWVEAYAYAVKLSQSWRQVRNARVVPA